MSTMNGIFLREHDFAEDGREIFIQYGCIKGDSNDYSSGMVFYKDIDNGPKYFFDTFDDLLEQFPDYDYNYYGKASRIFFLTEYRNNNYLSMLSTADNYDIRYDPLSADPVKITKHDTGYITYIFKSSKCPIIESDAYFSLLTIGTV